MNLRLCATRIRLHFRGYRYAIRRLACAIGYGDKGASPLVTIANTHRLLEQGGMLLRTLQAMQSSSFQERVCDSTKRVVTATDGCCGLSSLLRMQMNM